MSEHQLDRALLSLAQGNMDALDAVFRLANKRIYATALCVLHNAADADDVCQETYIKICKSAATYRNGENPFGWVCRIAKNTALDLLRRQKNHVPFDELENTIAEPSTEDEPAGAYAEVIAAAHACLDEEERQVLLLHTVGGLKHAKIAQMLQRPHATVRWLYRRAIEKVQRELEGKEA